MINRSNTNKNNGTEREYRYERKFATDLVTPDEVETVLYRHPSAFREIHHQRWINNIYFDSFDRHSLTAAVNGHTDRLKYRVRWYGRLFGHMYKPILELKHKHGWVGSKDRYGIEAFEFDRGFGIEVVRKAFDQSDLPDSLRLELSCLEPALVNRYSRRYYQSADGAYRVTIDTGLVFYQIDRYRSQFLAHADRSQVTIIEVKYDREDDDGVRKVLDGFPVRLTKSSKFVSGVTSLLPT